MTWVSTRIILIKYIWLIIELLKIRRKSLGHKSKLEFRQIFYLLTHNINKILNWRDI